MWGKHKKLQGWVEAGLLTQAQAAAIESHEENRKKGHFGRGLVNVSVFAIVIGILSIIASNWYEIPGSVKIGVHVLLNIGIGALALWSDHKGKDHWREGAALAFWGLTLTLIALIGQVFQMGDHATGAVTLWMIITLPFFLLMGRTYATAVPWMIALLTTIFMLMNEYIEPLPEYYQSYFVLGVGALLPLAFMADGVLAIFRHWRPTLAEVFLKTGLILSALFASIALIAWQHTTDYYYQDRISQEQSLVVLGVGLIALGLHAALYKFYKNDSRLKYGALYALVGLVALMLPFLLPSIGGAILSALAFIAYWVFIGWLAQGMSHMRIVSLAITIIAIRIFAVYIEVFGSLLETGVGLIVGGIVMLGLIWAARRMNARLTGKGAPHVTA